MAVEGIRGVVEAAIQRASQATGVDFSFLMKTAGRESGMNPHAKAGTSSAAGLFQFVEQTWLVDPQAPRREVRLRPLRRADRQGSRRPLPRERRRGAGGGDGPAARSARRLADGRASWRPTTANYLKGRTGRNPTAGELYAAHFLGPQGSARLIEAANASPARPPPSCSPTRPTPTRRSSSPRAGPRPWPRSTPT